MNLERFADSDTGIESVVHVEEPGNTNKEGRHDD
jgi:hypothetical protein